jgi:glutamine amidotransferase
MKFGLDKILKSEIIDKKKPVLGICSGMQILCNSSEEGNVKGLGFVSGDIKRFPDDYRLRVPHIGWNKVKSNNNPLFIDIDKEERFYFCHSYFFSPDNLSQKKMIISETRYGKSFCSSFNYKNIFGVQFHPEKSQNIGKKIIKNFSNL